VSSAPLPAGLVVVSRDGCHLCDDMLGELAVLESSGTIPTVTVVDVDSDPVLERQYGLKVPVLLLNGSVVCHYTLNSNELLRIIGRGPAILPR
jgi:hypothetical protein